MIRLLVIVDRFVGTVVSVMLIGLVVVKSVVVGVGIGITLFL